MRKAGALISTAAALEVQGRARFVSRGGYKLERALDDFGWTVRGLHCLDVGASTGGFTDCLLQRGAASVVSVDVGYGQLAWALRQNPGVKVVERANFRYADLAALGAPFDFACADVSFISLTKLAGRFMAALERGGKLVVLVKPQFESGRASVHRGGVVREPQKQVEAIKLVQLALQREGLTCSNLTYSPLRGPAGNIEFLLGAQRSDDSSPAPTPVRLDIEGVVRAAHEALNR